MANNLKILFISENYVKENSAIMQNVEDKLIKNNIVTSQNIHIQNILGTRLYDAIVDDFNKTGGTFTTYTTIIDDYIQPCLLYYTLYESMYDLYMKITNKSVVTQSSDYSEKADITLLEKRRSDYKNKAEFYAERLMNYLLDNTSDYPLFLNSDGTDPHSTMEPETNTNYFSGLYLGKKRKCTFLDTTNPRYRPLN